LLQTSIDQCHRALGLLQLGEHGVRSGHILELHADALLVSAHNFQLVRLDDLHVRAVVNLPRTGGLHLIHLNLGHLAVVAQGQTAAIVVHANRLGRDGQIRDRCVLGDDTARNVAELVHAGIDELGCIIQHHSDAFGVLTDAHDAVQAVHAAQLRQVGRLYAARELIRCPKAVALLQLCVVLQHKRYILLVLAYGLDAKQGRDGRDEWVVCDHRRAVRARQLSQRLQ
jgi:hypothetical protein